MCSIGYDGGPARAAFYKMLLFLKKLCYNKNIMKAKCIFSIMALTLISAAFAGNAALALTAQNEAEVEFTFNPSLTLSVSSSDIIISNLIPGTSDISNEIDVTVTTNNVGGYELSATTGNAQNATRNLVKDSSNYLESIAVGSSLSSLSNDTWGFTTNSGSTYSGLPLYTAAAVVLNSSNGPVNAAAGNTKFAIGAKASANKTAGNYTNVVNFTATSKVVLPAIQSFTTANCPSEPTLVIDVRDRTEYHIQKLADGRCWMLDNLALDITDPTILNNVTSSNTNASDISLVSLKSGNRAAGDQYATAGISTWKGDSYSVPAADLAYKDTIPPDAPVGSAGYNKAGGWYNYCAASAGSYCYGTDMSSTGSPSGDAIEDICPKGWRLPISKRDYGEYYELTRQYNNFDTLRTVFSLAWSGYDSSTVSTGGSALFWSSLKAGDQWMYSARAYVTNYGSGLNTDDSRGRNWGISIRCIAN